MWLRYFAHASITRDNRIFERDDTASNDKFILLHRDQHPELLFQGMPLAEDFTTHRPLLYPTLNRVHARLETPSNTPQSPDNLLKVHMSHTTPCFDHYEVNGSPFAPVSIEPWAWTLQPGANSLVVRTVNTAGIKGAPTRIELIYHPRKQANDRP